MRITSITLQIFCLSLSTQACMVDYAYKVPRQVDGPGTKPEEKPLGPGISSKLSAEIFKHPFSPALADDRVVDWADNSYALIDNQVPQHNLLAVYLPGAGANPADVDRKIMAETAASFGVHVLSLKYVNDTPQQDLLNCIFTLGTRCHGPFHLEQLEGRDESSYVDVMGPENAIETRVYAQLKYLAQSYPDEGWGQYLSKDRVFWEKIIVFGHSAGAAMAGYIGKVRHVHRVVMLSGPFDGDEMNRPADWVVDSESATPLENFYGFTHEADEQYPRHLIVWKAMGMPDPVRFESLGAGAVLAPRRFFSSNNANGGPAHNRTEASLNAPKTNGVFDYLPLWRYLLLSE